MTRPIRVLVVDDSALVRQALTSLLGRDPGIEVVGTAPDPLIARSKIASLHPDVLTLDVEMPRMDGLQFLEELMRTTPLPVLMVSSLTERGCATTLRAMELGAVDFVTKPKLDVRERIPEIADDLIRKVRAAAGARVRRPAATAPAAPVAGTGTQRLARGSAMFATTHKIVAVGASTGGTEALREFLLAFPADGPGIVVVQHMPARFTRAFAERLDGLCAIRVREAEDGDHVLSGQALIAPGNRHMRLVRSGATYGVRLGDEPPVGHHRPSVDVLFDACADVAGRNVVAVIMTGMGDDGARGMAALRAAGAVTLAQDERSCVVFGMPKAAIELGGVQRVLPLGELAAAVLTSVAGSELQGVAHA